MKKKLLAVLLAASLLICTIASFSASDIGDLEKRQAELESEQAKNQEYGQ